MLAVPETPAAQVSHKVSGLANRVLRVFQRQRRHSVQQERCDARDAFGLDSDAGRGFGRGVKDVLDGLHWVRTLGAPRFSRALAAVRVE